MGNFFVSVLPLSCSYLWGLYDDEDRVTVEETTQDQSSRNLPESGNNFGTVSSAEVLNLENTEAMRSSNAIQYVSVNNDIEKTELDKSQEKLCVVKEYVKETVNEKGENQLDTASSSPDTDDYYVNNFATNEIRSCSELSEHNGKEKNAKIENEQTKKEKIESDNLRKDQSVVLKDTGTKNASRLKKNGILRTDVKFIGNTAKPSGLASGKKLKSRQYAENSKWNTKDGKLSMNRKNNVSKNMVNALNFQTQKYASLMVSEN